MNGSVAVSRTVDAWFAVRSSGSPVPLPCERPLSVSAAMFAAFALVTASLAIVAATEPLPGPAVTSLVSCVIPPVGVAEVRRNGSVAVSRTADAWFAVRSCGSPVPAACARPLNVSAAICASLELLTALATIAVTSEPAALLMSPVNAPSRNLTNPPTDQSAVMSVLSATTRSALSVPVAVLTR